MKIYSLLLIIIINLFYINTGICQYNLRNPDIATKISVKKIDLIHLISPNEDVQDVEIGDLIGTVAPIPKKLSDKFDEQIKESKNFYSNQQFEKASKILERPSKIESMNPFILNEYARALYRIESKSDICYETYKKLIGIFDSTYHNSDTIIVIDIWFREAYWKLGTLHMDNNNWSDGFYEINRFLCSIQNEKGKPVYEQALSYLTECAYEMGERELCLHFANRVLFYNPENEYVKYYLTRINNK
ncbi:MAG: hypothetical protein ISS18_12235 [Bacteroidales bacterium]|nr:hypothetical protein [Bacteroidales bacterium]